MNESYAESDLNDSLSCSLNEDPDFNPYFEGDISASEESYCENETFDQNSSSAFIVFWSCLLSLLKRCLLCSASAFVEKISYRGSMISVSLLCEKGHSNKWYSQPIINGMALGNLRLACGVVLSGLTFQSVSETLGFSKIQGISSSTFYMIQRKVLQPVVNEFFLQNNRAVIEAAKLQGGVEVCGDRQCDSPGYSAKYGIYSILNKLTGKILAFRVVHVSEAGNSNNTS